MGIIRLFCSSCGASLEVSNDREYGFCQYCGSKYLLQETINLNVKIDNNNENKIELAYQYINENNYEKAEKLFKEILKNDIDDYKAWWGIFICVNYYSEYYGYTDRYGDTNNKIKASIISDNLKYAYEAIKRAPEQIKNEYLKNIFILENFVREYK